MGVTQGTISRWEKGKQPPDMHALIKLAVHLGIDDVASFALGQDEEIPDITNYTTQVAVVGGVSLEKHRESVEWETDYHRQFDFPIPWEWRAYKLKAFVIEDDSIDRHFKAGSIVVAASFDSNKLAPKPGDMLVFAERDERDLYSVSVREYLISAANPDRAILATDSSTGHHTVEVRVTDIETAAAGRELSSLGFIGVVVAAMSIVAPDRLPHRERSAPPPPPPPPTIED